MPLRYSKAKWNFLIDRARRRVVKARLTHNDEMLSNIERKAVRQLHRKLLVVRQRGLDQMLEASVALGLYDGELEGIPTPSKPRPVPVLTKAQEAWLRGITPEAFSLDKAVQMYADGVKK